MLGDILPSRNDPWLNAGPRAFIAFMCDNADIKFPLRLPIQNETLEMLLYDVKRHAHCGQRNIREQAFDMQAAMATQAGYFGGYAAKRQHVGERGTRKMYESTQRSIASSKTVPASEDFKKYSRRLVRDLELKGIVRTAVEGTNLSLHAAHTDILEAECVRTFPTIRFPANELLKREEIETLKKGSLHHYSVTSWSRSEASNVR